MHQPATAASSESLQIQIPLAITFNLTKFLCCIPAIGYNLAIAGQFGRIFRSQIFVTGPKTPFPTVLA